MSGTITGGKLALAKILAKNPNHFKEIGAIGGRNGHGPNYNSGFAAMTPEKRREAGARGGRISRKTKKVTNV